MNHLCGNFQTPFPRRLVILLAFALAVTQLWAGQDEPKKLKALFLTGGGYHDYNTLAPHLTTNIAKLINVQFDVKFTLDSLTNKAFADAYDIVVFDVCFDNADSNVLANAMSATKAGKPAVFIHCGVHAFRQSALIKEWENCCGMRSKHHDPYQPFETRKVDPSHPVTKSFPDNWKTPGDELYQTIEVVEGSQPLLKAKSPSDGREHVVCWVHDYGKGRVFATTLGHDMKTAESKDYLRLLANGMLWACGKLDSSGNATNGLGKGSGQ